MTLVRRRTAAAGATALASVLALSACGGEGSAASGETRTVMTAHGEVKVPAEPERVVVLDTAELDSAITLGVKPVGSTRSDVASGFLKYLPKEKVEGIENVGNIAAPNLEKIAALKPDLILGSDIRDKDRYDELSKIAPTVFTETTGAPWKQNFLVHANALNRQDEAEKVIDAYEAKTAEVTEALGGPKKARELTVSVVRFVEGADTRVYGRQNYIGSILADIGVSRPAIADKAPDGFSVDVSPEKVDQGDADVVFYTSYGDPAKSGEDKAVGGALWKSMEAVENGRAHRVDDETWIQGIGYTAADTILEEMKELLPKGSGTSEG
ncbi:ABC transporter substrate-binding protein [Streptomyces fenghuangensis]|uniref:ABC transporter substrate-binding protein n=1 Tax=Streptomyces chitinivorans TaxID=1257027 RepID=A0ABW7I0S6_9ACTN|nr:MULTISPECIES: iron-siderophore ABC transporter substrate-binding protein [Streptomyces]MCG3042844.1 iron-siderophore ABC transporter substrate-binding protein [Streptomyces sp. ICN903]MDH2410206.1 iron-siderophore ABC transporter substrate-binding protein [Streptomyces chitinivorans]